MKKEYIIPSTLIVCSFILGGSYLLVQLNKQNSIERQHEAKIEREKEVEEAKKREEKEDKILYDLCVDEAERKYWSYVQLNGTEKADGSIQAPGYTWNRAEDKKKDDIENCETRYLK